MERIEEQKIRRAEDWKVRRQRIDDGGQRTEDRWRRSDDGRKELVIGYWIMELGPSKYRANALKASRPPSLPTFQALPLSFVL